MTTMSPLSNMTVAEAIFRHDVRVHGIVQQTFKGQLDVEGGALWTDERISLAWKTAAPDAVPYYPFVEPEIIHLLYDYRNQAEKLAQGVNDERCIVHDDCRRNEEQGRLCEEGRRWQNSALHRQTEALVTDAPRLMPFPFPLATIRAGESGRVSMQPQVVNMRPVRLVIERNAAEHLHVVNIQVGQASILGSVGTIPGILFADSAYPFKLDAPTVDISQLVSVHLVNTSFAPVSVSMVLLAEPAVGWRTVGREPANTDLLTDELRRLVTRTATLEIVVEQLHNLVERLQAERET